MKSMHKLFLKNFQELIIHLLEKLKVVYSEELPTRPLDDGAAGCKTECVCPPGTARTCAARRDVPGSVAFVPSVAGLIIAGEVVKDLIKIQ